MRPMNSLELKRQGELALGDERINEHNSTLKEVKRLLKAEKIKVGSVDMVPWDDIKIVLSNLKRKVE